MRLLRSLVMACMFVSGPCGQTAATAEAAIRAMLNAQVEAWNRGDVAQFVSWYSPHCTLVGKDVSDVTRAEVLAHYQQKYPSAGAMGKLTFSGLVIRPLNDRIAVVTGHWHLDRDDASGGPVGGV